ncbi:MAG: AEC family transporter [Candidatus Omnitrophica bacterium]|nr:AEC family transporter [Candidatus Omnitrophota bacterium]
MFLESVRVTLTAVIQVFLLGGLGYLMVRKKFLSDTALEELSKLILNITLPLLIFSQLLVKFSFVQYPDWWIFPLISISITGVGLIVGRIFSIFIKGEQNKAQFSSLIAFQNSGYLPLALIGVLLPKEKAEAMFIYLFLFLIGFNLTLFSFGVYMLTLSKADKFNLITFFNNPPVISALAGLLTVFLGLNKTIPAFLIKPFNILGECTLPLAILVVGGNLAQIHLSRILKKEMFLLVFAKLILLPLLGLFLILKLGLSELLGLLILIELAVPSAMNLAVIIRHYKKEDLLISQGIFLSHVLSVITVPIFLSLYFILVMIK